MSFFIGQQSKPGKIKSLPNYDAGQTNILNQLQQGTSNLLGGGLNFLSERLSDNPDAFERYIAPQRERFERETIPGIAERFTSDFGEGSYRSGAFGQALGESARGFQRDIESQREQLKSDSFAQLLQLLQPVLAPRKTYYAQPGREAQPGFLHHAAEAALKIATMLPFLP